MYLFMFRETAGYIRILKFRRYKILRKSVGFIRSKSLTIKYTVRFLSFPQFVLATFDVRVWPAQVSSAATVERAPRAPDVFQAAANLEVTVFRFVPFALLHDYAVAQIARQYRAARLLADHLRHEAVRWAVRVGQNEVHPGAEQCFQLVQFLGNWAPVAGGQAWWFNQHTVQAFASDRRPFRRAAYAKITNRCRLWVQW